MFIARSSYSVHSLLASIQNSELEQQQSDLDEVCACCGVAAVDDVKLKICDDGCNLVKYCSGKCHENHREQHEKECTERKTELHDKELFTQPHSSHIGECPICFCCQLRRVNQRSWDVAAN